MQHRRQCAGNAVSFKRLLAAQHFVVHQAHREKVGAAIVRLLHQNFGSHVGGRAAHRRRKRCRRHRRIIGIRIAQREPPGHAKIQHFDSALRRQHDVFRLDVSVQDSLFVGCVQTFQTLCCHFEKLVHTAIFVNLQL